MYNRSVSEREHVSMNPMLNYVKKFAKLIVLINILYALKQRNIRNCNNERAKIFYFEKAFV